MNCQFSTYNKTKASIFAFSVSLLMLSFSSNALLYKWVDANGETRYGDKLPPEHSNKKYFQLDPEGRIILIKEVGKSPKQLKEERALAKKKEQEKMLAEKTAKEERIKQDRQDRILLLTFNSEDDIFYARDQRLLVLDSKIALLKKNKVTSQKKLLVLDKQAQDQYLFKKQKVPGGLQQKIEQMSKNILSIDGSINQSERKRSEVITGFKKDLVRFRDLKARQRKRQNEYN